MTSPAGVAALAALAADGLAGAGWSSPLSVLVLMRKYGCGMLVYVYVCIYIHAHVCSMCIVYVYIEGWVSVLSILELCMHMCVCECEHI